MHESSGVPADRFVLRLSYVSASFDSVEQARAQLAIEQAAATATLGSRRSRAVNVDIVETYLTADGRTEVTIVESLVFVVPAAASPGPVTEATQLNPSAPGTGPGAGGTRPLGR